MTNRFDRACNFILIRIFPHFNYNEESERCYAALKYAHNDLQTEKEKLKEVRRYVCKHQGTLIRDALNLRLKKIENNQYERHSTMKKILEGKR